MRLARALVFIILVAGCSIGPQNFRWAGEGLDPGQIKRAKDWEACKGKAQSAQPMSRRTVARGCMADRGWLHEDML